MQQLHPGARWQFRFRAYFGLLVPVFFISYFVNSFWIFSKIAESPRNIPSQNSLIGAFLIYLFIAIIFVLIFGEIYARMAYNRWFYEFTDTNLKVESGIIWKKYSNVPYERVQNVDIRRGILARILGFSSVMIQTAGYSGYGGRSAGLGAEGYLPAVDPAYAEKIRDFLMGKISKKGSASGGL
jgi:membrane protein YdbS with pleckstrin-like domain